MELRSGLLCALGLLAGVAAAPRSAAGQIREWVLLGQRTVENRIDHDIFVVTGGDYRRIKLSVHRASVDFHRVVVHYGNGSDQEIALRHTIPAGEETRAIDLEGQDRILRSVEFWYDANTLGRRRAVVRLYGLR